MERMHCSSRLSADVASRTSATGLSRTLIASAALLLMFVAPALAGKFHAYSCRTPAGEAAPADGWTGSVAKEGAYDQYAINTCSTGGALTAALGEQTTHFGQVDMATWAFETPAHENLVAATIWRATRSHYRGGEKGTYETWMSGPVPTQTFDGCIVPLGCESQGEVGHPFAAANRVAVPAANLGAHLYGNAACFSGFRGEECGNGFGDPSGYAVAWYMYAADLVLEQTEAPSASNVGGQLASEQPVSGTSDLVFSATDPGSGVYEALFSIDGSVLQTTPVNENEGHCRNVGQTMDGLPAFLYLQPCLKSLTADVGFDTTRVSNGPHHLVVSISDAAGNTATVLDRSILVENKVRGPCNGTCDEHAALHATQARLLRRAFIRRYANSGLTLSGQLVDSAGSPTRRAMIELRQQASYVGARSVLVATTTTNASGGWRLYVPKGPSRLLTVGYRSHTNDAVFAAQLQYRETVRAGVRLSAPRVARPGRTFAFRGYLAGGYTPRGGALVSLEIHYGGEWREIALLRTNRRGAFLYRYTFAAIGPATYRFRAQVPQTSGYPFASAASRSRYIHLAG